MILSAKALSTFHICGKIIYRMENSKFNLIFQTITTIFCLLIEKEYGKKVCKRLKSSVLSSAHVCERKLQEFREHVNLTSHITILSVWFGLQCNFLLRRHHILSKYINCLVYLLNNYSNIPQGCNSVPYAVNESRRYAYFTFYWGT